MSLEKIIKGIKKVKSSLKKAVGLGIVGAALATSGVKASDEYEIIKLEVKHLGGFNRTYVFDINNKGDVAGAYELFLRPLENLIKKPFVFTYEDRTFRELKGGVPEDFFGSAIGISDSDLGAMVLYEENKDSYPASVKESYVCHHIYDQDSLHLYSFGFIIKDISNNGLVVGENYVRINRQTINLCPDSNNCEAYGVNDDGIVVGCSKEEFYDYPVFWEDGKMIQLPVPKSGDGGCALGINNNRQIIGYLLKDCGRPGCKYSPCLWEGESVTELSPLTQAYAINDLGQIVGTIDGKKAVLWEKEVINGVENGVITDLNEFIPQDSNGPSDWEYLCEAIKINNNGQIIGYGYLNYDKGGYYRTRYAFLMTQKPKPLEGDLNKDGIVNLKDLSELANHWLEEN